MRGFSNTGHRMRRAQPIAHSPNTEIKNLNIIFYTKKCIIILEAGSRSRGVMERG